MGMVRKGLRPASSSRFHSYITYIMIKSIQRSGSKQDKKPNAKPALDQ